MVLVRGTCVARRNAAVLIEGPSGAGKSDLALRLIDRGWRLVADDYTEVEIKKGRLEARSPKVIVGKIEVRGLGIRRVPALAKARIRLVVRLVARGKVPRLPKSARRVLGGVALPLRTLHAFDASTPIKIELALKAR